MKGYTESYDVIILLLKQNYDKIELFINRQMSIFIFIAIIYKLFDLALSN